MDVMVWLRSLGLDEASGVESEAGGHCGGCRECTGARHASLGGGDRQSNSGSLAMFAAMRQVSLSLCNREWKTRPLAAALRFLHERVYRIAERPMLRPGAGIANMRTPKERGIPHLFADGAPIDPTKQKDGRSRPS